jgi:hypothetical protein
MKLGRAFCCVAVLGVWNYLSRVKRWARCLAGSPERPAFCPTRNQTGAIAEGHGQDPLFAVGGRVGRSHPKVGRASGEAIRPRTK